MSRYFLSILLMLTSLGSFSQYVLVNGQELQIGERLVSNQKCFYASLNSDGNFTLNNSQGQELWSSNTKGFGANRVKFEKGRINLYNSSNQKKDITVYFFQVSKPFGSVPKTEGFHFDLQDDGNGVIYNKDRSKHYWSTKTSLKFDCIRPPLSPLKQKDRLSEFEDLDENMSLISSNGRYILTLSKYGFQLKEDNKPIKDIRYDISPRGPLRCSMQRDGNFVVYDTKGAIWSTKTDRKASRTLLLDDDGSIKLLTTEGNLVKTIFQKPTSKPTDTPPPPPTDLSIVRNCFGDPVPTGWAIWDLGRDNALCKPTALQFNVQVIKNLKDSEGPETICVDSVIPPGWKQDGNPGFDASRCGGFPSIPQPDYKNVKRIVRATFTRPGR